jgi:biopolymer transport protein ExbD
MKRRAFPENPAIEQPAIAPFIDITFQLLIFFMLTIKFKQEEGHLLSFLPDEKGPNRTIVPDIELNEIRIYLCGDSVTHRFDQHIGYKERHQDIVADLKRAGNRIGDSCRAWIDLRYLQNDTAELYSTERFPAKASHNRSVYVRLADQVLAMRQQVRSTINPGKLAPVIIDSDGLVPWEHPFGLLNALQKRGINDVEWAGNPRFDRYFGSSPR